MKNMFDLPKPVQPAVPVCPLFGECGGCQYQDRSYVQELLIKERTLRDIFADKLPGTESLLRPVVASPQEYHYRSRMDLRLLRTRAGQVFMGFAPHRGYQVVEASACPIAMKPISDFLPELKRQAIAKLTSKYRNANLVVKTGDDGRVFWGGIGRHSLRQPESDYLYTDIDGRRIFYSLDTFFQANLAILPALMHKLRSLEAMTPDTVFLDLYGGVGLFGLCLADSVGRVILIEENIHATRLAEYNRRHHQLDHFQIISRRVEEALPDIMAGEHTSPLVAMIDPPRNGLTAEAAAFLAGQTRIGALVYLSCHPESLVRDLAVFLAQGWTIAEVTPFDFFPRTRHLETLAVLRRGNI